MAALNRGKLWQHPLTVVVLILISSSTSTLSFVVGPSNLRVDRLRDQPITTRLVSREDTQQSKPLDDSDGKESAGGTAANRSQDSKPNGDLVTPPKPGRQHFFTYVPRKAIEIYSGYASRLWKETSVSERQKIALDKARQAILKVQHVFRGEEYADLSSFSQGDRQNLLDACDHILASSSPSSETLDIEEVETKVNVAPPETKPTTIVTTTDEVVTAQESAPVKKKGRSVLFGAAMGLGAAGWVFSGNYVFTALFMAMTILGQLEYYRMVMNTGAYPARRISVVGATSMFFTALFAPDLHQICLPMFGLAAIVQFLKSRHENPSIQDIATTFSGMFYLGYVPSFWVRIRLIGEGLQPTRLAPIAGPILAAFKQKADARLPAWMPKAIHLPITTGAIFIFWTWLSLAFSDVGAYFVGRRFGKTKLGAVSECAGITSPNKTVEGVIGGCLVSAAIATFGAWVQKWPYWQVTGAIHGLVIGFLGLIGDLTASMLKRDAGLKDFGDLIPEHGGILDRVDSFVWTAPYSWLVCAKILPALRAIA